MDYILAPPKWILENEEKVRYNPSEKEAHHVEKSVPIYTDSLLEQPVETTYEQFEIPDIENMIEKVNVARHGNDYYYWLKFNNKRYFSHHKWHEPAIDTEIDLEENYIEEYKSSWVREIRRRFFKEKSWLN